MSMKDGSNNSHWHKRCRTLLMAATDEARRLQHAYLGVEHLFNAMTRTPEGPTKTLLHSLNLRASQVREAIRREVGMGSGTLEGALPFFQG